MRFAQVEIWVKAVVRVAARLAQGPPGLQAILILPVALSGVSANAAILENLTGLPTYPHVTRAAMDESLHTEALGRWCERFTASTNDSLEGVEDWYRRMLVRASETDLARDSRFAGYATLTGIKLSVGRDYVAIYRLPDQPTTIELHRCEISR